MVLAFLREKKKGHVFSSVKRSYKLEQKSLKWIPHTLLIFLHAFSQCFHPGPAQPTGVPISALCNADTPLLGDSKGQASHLT